MNAFTVKEICDNFIELERQYDLLNRDFAGVKVWQLLRMILYYRVTEKTGTFTKAHSEKLSRTDMLKGALFFLYASVKNPLQGNQQRDTLIFDHSRKVSVDGVFCDIYTKYLIDELPAGSFEVYESVSRGRHLSKPSPYIKYLDLYTVLGHLAGRFSTVVFSEEETHLISELERELDSRFGITEDLHALFKEEIGHFRFGVRFYDRLLKKRKPKKIYVVVSYSFYKRALIAAAKQNNIPIIEIQHGTMSPYHLGYHFPDNRELAYFPDYFYSFGTYWTDIVSLPLPKDHIIERGFDHFRNQRKQFPRDPKPGQVLFISQGAIGKRLAEFAFETAKQLPDYRFQYKLHPGEYALWKQDYPDLVSASKLPNFEVIAHNNQNLYHYFSQAESVVGVFSTAIYEGLAFGCNTVVVDLPGVEYMDLLVEKQVVTKVTSPSDLKSALLAHNHPRQQFTFF